MLSAGRFVRIGGDDKGVPPTATTGQPTDGPAYDITFEAVTRAGRDE